MYIQPYVYMNKITCLCLGIGAILMASIMTQQAFANHETMIDQQVDSNFEQNNRNGDNYIVIEQAVRQDQTQETNYNYNNNNNNNNNREDGKGTFKVYVEWDGRGSLCIREDNHNRDVVECQRHNGGQTLFVIPKGIIPQGSSYEVCGGTHCEIFYNEVVKGPEYVSLNY